MEYMPCNIPFLGVIVSPQIPDFCSVVKRMQHTRMDWLPPLFIVVFGSMGGKSVCSQIPAYHGRLPAGSANHGEGLLIFSHPTTSNPSANYENFCCLLCQVRASLWQKVSKKYNQRWARKLFFQNTHLKWLKTPLS